MVTAAAILPRKEGRQHGRPVPLTAGRWCRLEALTPAVHAGDLFASLSEERQGALWTYMTYGPFESELALHAHLERLRKLPDRDFHAIIEQESGLALGYLALVRRRASQSAVELGHVVFSPQLQGTRTATEAVFLVLCQVFEGEGRKRLEWRADCWNRKGILAAQRFGFRREALARQDSHYKGRNRDTWWLSILAREWPALKQLYRRWLAPENFDAAGRQRSCLSDLTIATLHPLNAKQLLGTRGAPTFGASSQMQVDLSPPAPPLYQQKPLSRGPAAMKEPRVNELGQPIGEPLPHWRPRPLPPRQPMEGTWCRLEPLDPDRHAESLFEAKSQDASGRNWTYLPVGPFPDFPSYRAWLEGVAAAEDPLFHSVLDSRSGRALGVASFLRLQPELGVIEVGHIHFSPALQKNRMATEAMYLMMRRVFDELGYRRYEWKCDALNAPSRQAATRLGFTYEGIFRQATIYKGRNRDTAWYSIIDKEWPEVRAAFEAWLEPANFDGEGQQKRSLASLRSAASSRPELTEL